ncbi:MAG: DUF465 domain-containing protein [Hyphomicrobiaceae bacterium]|nr:DUF465 domain-containing protein [Hyphomicrobiaceae bacterium]
MMSIEGHMTELAEKHRALDQRIAEEMARPGSDDQHIRRLKREKLRLKEAMERLRNDTRH